MKEELIIAFKKALGSNEIDMRNIILKDDSASVNIPNVGSIMTGKDINNRGYYISFNLLREYISEEEYMNLKSFAYKVKDDSEKVYMDNIREQDRQKIKYYVYGKNV